MDENILRKLYANDKLSVTEIAQKCGVSRHKVEYWLVKYSIPRRSISEAAYAKRNPEGDPFTFVSPRTSKEWYEYGLAIGLFWGEGNKANQHSVRIGNTDPGIIKAFLTFLEKFYRVDRGKLKFSLQTFSDTDVENAEKYWANALSVSRSQFYKTTVTISGKVGTYRHKNTTGVLTLYFHNKKLRDILISALDQMPR